MQRKVLTPNDFNNLGQVPERLLAFQGRYESIAQPFRWEFTRQDLAEVLRKIDTNAADATLRCAA